MDRWLIPAVILLVLLAVILPVLWFIYGALVALVGCSAAYNAWTLPGPYLSLLDGCDGLRLNWLVGKNEQKDPPASRVAIIKGKTVVKVASPDRIELVADGKFAILSAAIPGLMPGEVYRYRIEVAAARGRWQTKWGGKKSHFTAPGKERLPPEARIRVATLGDMQPKSIMPPILQAVIMHQVRRTKPDLFIYLGDHTNTGNDMRAWLWYLRLAGIIGRSTPIIGTPGNHDGMKKNAGSIISGHEAYSKFVNYPGNGRYYHVKFGGIHFLSLDYQESIAPGTAQHGFVANVLGKGGLQPGEQLIVFSHSTPYNTAIKPSIVSGPIADMRAHVQPLVEKHQAMWLGGHEHAYQKFVVHDVPYITTAATSSFHDHDYTDEHMEMNVKRFHFVQIDVIGRSMRVTAIPVAGKPIDEFSIGPGELVSPKT